MKKIIKELICMLCIIAIVFFIVFLNDLVPNCLGIGLGDFIIKSFGYCFILLILEEHINIK